MVYLYLMCIKLAVHNTCIEDYILNSMSLCATFHIHIHTVHCAMSI